MTNEDGDPVDDAESPPGWSTDGEEEASVDGDGHDDSSTDADPFDEFSSAAADREGDPFAGLGEWDDTEPMSLDEDADAGGETTMPGEFDLFDDADVTSFDIDEPPESDPFSEMTPEFAELDLGDVDEDEVWEALSAAEARGSVADIQDRTYAEVSKHSYCEQCEYLSDPPETRCGHEGTEILAFTDMETVRVVDCPVVEERRRLEQEH